MIIHKDIKQQTPEWHLLKKGKMGASKASTIASNDKGLETYISELMADYYCDFEKEPIWNTDIERGNELEKDARSMYELHYCEVEEVGLLEIDDYIAISPDGVVIKGDKIKNGVEFKCPRPSKFLRTLLSNQIDKEHFEQCQMSLLKTNAEFWDYLMYCPEIKPYYYYRRITPCEKTFEKLIKGLERGTNLIKDYHKTMEVFKND